MTAFSLEDIERVSPCRARLVAFEASSLRLNKNATVFDPHCFCSAMLACLQHANHHLKLRYVICQRETGSEI